MPVSAPTRCKTCDAHIRFVRSSKTGKPIPLDAERVLIVDANGRAHFGYIPHWATCPHADEHRRRYAKGLTFEKKPGDMTEPG